MSNLIELEERDFAFQNRLQTFSIVNKGHVNINEFFEDAFVLFNERIGSIVDVQYIVKVGACFVAVFEKMIVNDAGDELEHRESQTIYLHTKAAIVDFETDTREFFNVFIVDEITERIEDIQLRGSGFSLAEIKELNIQVSQFEPIAGSTYMELPKFLRSKNAIINVHNKDEKCFKYAVLSSMGLVTKDLQRVSKYKPYENLLNFDGIEFPVKLQDITKFEQQNPTISINIYVFDDDKNKVRTMRLTKEVKHHHVHLLLLTKTYSLSIDDQDALITIESHLDDMENFNISHYCWIKNLSGLVSKQCSLSKRKKIFCDRCLNYFTTATKLSEHLVNCFAQNECQIEMPPEDNCEILFTEKKKQLKIPFIVYADIESILKKPDGKFPKTETTSAYQQHEAFSIGYYFKCGYDESESYYKSFRGPNCIEWFAEELCTIRDIVEPILKTVVPLTMTDEDEVFFIISDDCHICGEDYTDEDVRVRDHCHLTGKYRGSAHFTCNLQYQESRIVPVVFHNLSHYDSHFIIKQLAKMPGNISAIPLNDELYISFTKTMVSRFTKKYEQFIKFRFIDSFRFMASSLDHLSSILPSEKKKNLHSYCQNLSEQQKRMLERKGVFCYDYIDSWEKLNEEALPPKESFYSNLTESHISDEDYQFACNMWNEFNIKTIGEYSDWYLRTDILLLADVFENFRETCHTIYKLDPAHYFTAPGFTFDAMLKYTKVRIQLQTNIDKLMMIERGIRGGISQCSKRYMKANNKYMSKYDQNVETSYLMYLDANNLYGHSMMQHLPIGDFEWCNEMFSTEQILELKDDAEIGYIFEVDLECPQHLHNKHKDYPFCPENRIVPGTKRDKKLLLTLFDKKNYVIHMRMLKLVLEQGLVLKKIHRVLKFAQEPFLKPYIELNTALRTQATNEFEKELYKLMINAIYGKTMENMRARVNIQLKADWGGRYGIRKLIALPNFKRFNILDEDLVAIHLNKTTIVMDKPVAVGMAVLDLSKLVMYDFFYNHLQPKYGENMRMAYTDTDSFILEVKTDCFYSDMQQSIEKYDTSDYAESNVFNMPRCNKKVPGLFKDELKGEVMTEFVGLRSKMYCVKIGDVLVKDRHSNDVVKMKMKAKGVKKYVLNSKITFKNYLDCIQNKSIVSRSQNTFRSKNHTVYSISQHKVALSSLDNKRYVLNDNIDTLPWGHFEIPQ
ncbi:PolB [Mayetiola barley midge adintovirus]|uniref:PolB n=1 Tax=Mayetiola barley midge adintovirus TaxID=2609858 RepID=UPI002481E624|nr:PolB [Mayetiola barley midge adintovirus]DAC81320.1 TPA_asm: PolB [Mayetiola barley midge adintovirus]